MVIAIIAILAALIFPVFSAAKEAAKVDTCLSNNRQLAIGMLTYADDNDGRFVQTKRSVNDPAMADRDGSAEEPDYGPAWSRVFPQNSGIYRQRPSIFTCPTDPDPFGEQCAEVSPDAPPLNSALINAYFAFGLNQSSLRQPSSTIMLAERNSSTPYCDYLYRPWYNADNSQAPEDEMDDTVGAIATERHSGRGLYAFADGHVKTMEFSQTYGPNVNMHQP